MLLFHHYLRYSFQITWPLYLYILVFAYFVFASRSEIIKIFGRQSGQSSDRVSVVPANIFAPPSPSFFVPTRLAMLWHTSTIGLRCDTHIYIWTIGIRFIAFSYGKMQQHPLICTQILLYSNLKRKEKILSVSTFLHSPASLLTQTLNCDNLCPTTSPHQPPRCVSAGTIFVCFLSQMVPAVHAVLWALPDFKNTHSVLFM